jgi:hypothetical protein
MYQMRILVNDKPVPIYRDYRTGTDWIEARNETKYVIEVKNNGYNRILAVSSVDGLNVINGKHEDSLTAPGYILHPYNNIKIPGWKISAEDVREFFFTPQESSYSTKLGANPANTGVIATAIFKEKIAYTYAYTTSTYNPNTILRKWDTPVPTWNDNTFQPVNLSGNVSAGGSSASPMMASTCFSVGSEKAAVYNMNYMDAMPEPKLATGSGEVKDFRTHKASFGERVLEATLILYYDTREGLIRRGIDVSRIDGLPKPFPNGQYCPNI